MALIIKAETCLLIIISLCVATSLKTLFDFFFPKLNLPPVAYKPERFMNKEGNGVEAFDVTGRKEIKMIPFGAGRRICPGYDLAILHLEYFVANWVLNFEWRAVDGEEVDLSEKQELTIVMKNLLQVHFSPRWK